MQTAVATVHRPEPASSPPRVPRQSSTLRRWRGRLASSALMLMQALVAAGAAMGTVLKEVGAWCTRAEMVEALTDSGGPGREGVRIQGSGMLDPSRSPRASSHIDVAICERFATWGEAWFRATMFDPSTRHRAHGEAREGPNILNRKDLGVEVAGHQGARSLSRRSVPPLQKRPGTERCRSLSISSGTHRRHRTGAR